MQSVPVPVTATPRSARQDSMIAAVRASATMDSASTRAPSPSGTDTCARVLIVPV